jgi:hypothetical protein
MIFYEQEKAGNKSVSGLTSFPAPVLIKSSLDGILTSLKKKYHYLNFEIILSLRENNLFYNIEPLVNRVLNTVINTAILESDYKSVNNNLEISIDIYKEAFAFSLFFKPLPSQENLISEGQLSLEFLPILLEKVMTELKGTFFIDRESRRGVTIEVEIPNMVYKKEEVA